MHTGDTNAYKYPKKTNTLTYIRTNALPILPRLSVYRSNFIKGNQINFLNNLNGIITVSEAVAGA